MTQDLLVEYVTLTDRGMRRAINEDSLAVKIADEPEDFRRRGHLFVVADGMGGHAVGELASKLAVDTVPHALAKSSGIPIPEALKQAVEAANQVINERGEQNSDFARMGTTCSSLVLSSEGAVIGHVGDSRVYRVRETTIAQLTFDHSYAWELERMGHQPPPGVEIPTNVITRCLGPEPAVEVDIEGPLPTQIGDCYLLCSDGLTAHLDDPEIGQIVYALPLADAAKLLVNLALLRGGSDNVTVVLCRVVGDGGRGGEAGSLELQTEGETREY